MGDKVPVNCLHAKCPNCGESIDVIPADGTFFLKEPRIFEDSEPYTWAKLKEFCNSLNDEQLSQTVRVIREDESIEILDASEIGEDHYKFDDEEYSITKEDFDYAPDQVLDGKYSSLDEAIKNEEYILTPKTNVYLFEKF